MVLYKGGKKGLRVVRFLRAYFVVHFCNSRRFDFLLGLEESYISQFRYLVCEHLFLVLLSRLYDKSLIILDILRVRSHFLLDYKNLIWEIHILTDAKIGQI